MAGDIPSANLQTILERSCEKVLKPRFNVLFRHGDSASGMFVVLRGKVSLGFGDNSAFDRSYGPGALVGLPSTLTRRNYCMTATVTEDAELGFWSPEALDSLLHNRPDLCQQLLVILREKLAENYELQEASLRKSKGNDRDSMPFVQ
jgi:CRP-like cAMP-binding protein